MLSNNSQPCYTPGLNIHSCSAMTSKDRYCYFNDGQTRCQEYLTGTALEAVVSKYWSDQKIGCANLNQKSCPLNIWTMNNKCIFNGTCINLDFINDPLRS